MNVQIQFIEEGIAENPFAPRSWSLVPRVGDTVTLPETGREYRVLGVHWGCLRRPDGSVDENEPLVTVRVED